MAVSLDAVRRTAASLLAPGRFYAGSGITLVWRHDPAKRVAWEIFQGRLLDAAQTREAATFESWNVILQAAAGLAGEPLLSLELDAAAGRLYVVRAIDSYVWEGYTEGNVCLSRERRRWVRGLLATFDLADWPAGEPLADEVARALAEAVTGARLPLTPPVLLARSLHGPGLTVYDTAWTPRLEMEPLLEHGYVRRRGVELPAGGLRVRHQDRSTVDLQRIG